MQGLNEPTSSVPVSRSAGLGLKERREATGRRREAEDLEGLSNGDWEQMSDQVEGGDGPPAKKGGGAKDPKTETRKREPEGKKNKQESVDQGGLLRTEAEGKELDRSGGEVKNATEGAAVAFAENEELGIDDDDEQGAMRAAGTASNRTQGQKATPKQKKGGRTPSLLVRLRRGNET